MKKKINYIDIVEKMYITEQARTDFINSIYQLYTEYNIRNQVDKTFYKPNDKKDILYQRFLFGKITISDDIIDDLEKIIDKYEELTK